MRNIKTTLAGLVTGLPFVIDALVQAYSAGYFTGKTGLQLYASIGIIILGFLVKDHNTTGTGN